MNDPLSNTLRKLIQQRDEILDALKLAEIVMGNNIYPKPDVGPNHPYSILLKVRSVIAKAEAAQTDRLVGEHVETEAKGVGA